MKIVAINCSKSSHGMAVPTILKTAIMASVPQLRIPKVLKADCVASLPSASFLLSYARVPPGCDIKNSSNIIRFILPTLWPFALPIVRVLCLHCLSSCASFALGIFRVVLPVHIAWTPNDFPILHFNSCFQKTLCQMLLPLTLHLFYGSLCLIFLAL